MSSFAVTWDYRCPFARNAHEHLLVGLEDGATWDVRFVPFSLGQAHVEVGDVDIWDRPDQDSGLLALQAGVVVRDRFPDRFLAAHRAFFEARHDRGLQIQRPEVVESILGGVGVDAAAVLTEIETGAPLETVRQEHTAVVESHAVWGVPTFIYGDDAVFIRLMNRPEGDAAVARSTIDRAVALLGGWPELNEYKHTVVRR